jgi:hypothetical protein
VQEGFKARALIFDHGDGAGQKATIPPVNTGYERGQMGGEFRSGGCG